MQIIHQLKMLRKTVGELRADGNTIAIVPTMGALHEGHLTLVRAAKQRADHVIATIFVNPTQFGPNEDLDAYPRQLAHDAAMLEAEGTAALWAPAVEEMYPNGFSSSIRVAGVSEGFCGADRPGHFDGVATVVCKLFNQVRPDLAFFGEKDWQQLAVIRQMARDLDLVLPKAADIIGVPTVREADGLAMSSRNRYLDQKDRAAAVALPNGMKHAIAAIASGEVVTEVLAQLKASLITAGFASVDYARLADADSLTPLDTQPARPARLLVAARIGGTRLIDNMAVPA